MKNITPSFQYRTLSNTKNENEYKLYIAALEWNLVDPIVIESADDFISKKEWEDKLEPYHHQVTNLITFCRRLPVTLLADDVGLGKTISAGLIISELISRSRISKILIVCPKILMQQWREELDLKFGINSTTAIGSDLPKVKLPEGVGVVITTYHSAKAYLDIISEKGYQMLILDEAHKLRNLYGTNSAPQIALKFQRALKERIFKYVLMLTATPIQNRLWDIYSLVDLLATSKGHKNPFGTEGLFARNYILDSRTSARQLIPQKKDDFRRIVYNYMYRTRRSEVRLYFPERIVQLNRVRPTEEELNLIKIIAAPIQSLNPLVQVSLLQAIVSSPQAFLSQLKSMDNNKTINHEIVEQVGDIVNTMKTSAKLEGLKLLINELKKERGDTWRMVIFTERIETQTSIAIFLDEQNIPHGLINGSSGIRNQQTIDKFKKEIPEINVVISTRAGSEGVNLQVSNILVNYDLPWNPMIVEQRIGRIQRLASPHKNVVIFNMILGGTFEEHIVGRLMEKLQMASSAIGDIDALLEAAGVDEDKGFEDKIRQLVVDSLAGKDVEKATHMAEESIKKAKEVLKEEEENMNILLGGSSDFVDNSPKCPKLPPHQRSMSITDFTLGALNKKNISISQESDDIYSIKYEGKHEKISFSNSNDAIVCKPGVPFFERLVTEMVNEPISLIVDVDENIEELTKDIVNKWISKFDGELVFADNKKFQVTFTGQAILRVNITVAHDSYERLLKIDCSTNSEMSSNYLLKETISNYINNPEMFGLSADYFKGKIFDDCGVFEFCNFYQKRLEHELMSVDGDEMKTRKIEDDFTPRIDVSLVALDGKISRNSEIDVKYKVDNNFEYSSSLVAKLLTGDLIFEPNIETCGYSRIKAPQECFDNCCVSKKRVLKHFLKKSDISGRMALSEFFNECSLSRQSILKDESGVSDITGNTVALALMKTSAVSGKIGEPDYFDKCYFTESEVLKNEIAISQISGKKYRIDQEKKSFISNRKGHEKEFIVCSEKGIVISFDEAETCELTGKVVAKGVLEKCEISGKMVIPSELLISADSNKKALKKYFVNSSISGKCILEEEAVRSDDGIFCSKDESQKCFWSNNFYHPNDLLIDSISGLPINHVLIKKERNNSFSVLLELLDGKVINESNSVQEKITQVFQGIYNSLNFKIDSLEYSLDEQRIAVCLSVKSLFGLKIRYYGFLFSVEDNKIIGKVSTGKRIKNIWINNT